VTLEQATQLLTQLAPKEDERQFATNLSADMITVLAKRQAPGRIALLATLATLDSLARQAKIKLADLHDLINAMRVMSNSIDPG
jgi:hypothetical protein